MEYRKDGNRHIIKLKKGEKILESLKEFLKVTGIKGGYFIAIGAVSKAEIACYIPSSKEYKSIEIKEALEICSLLGIISEDFIHSHAVFSKENFECVGGHLKEAEVSATCEIVFAEMKKLRRKFDAETGLNLLEL